MTTPSNAPFNEVYLDANATTHVLPQAIAAVDQAMRDGFGNPSSTHGSGLRANALLTEVRERATRFLNAESGRLLFTSGATESIQTAVLSALCEIRARRDRGEQTGTLLLYGATEHKAVPESLAHWNRILGLNCQLEVIPVDGNGRHDLDFLKARASAAGLVCTMAANNETGVISDLEGIENTLSVCAVKPLWLVDSVQALGKLPLKLAQTRIDYAAFSGHKLYAPKGIGLLYVRQGAPYTPLLAGGGQESGLRSGTENMTGIAALGAVFKALEQGDTFRDSATLHAFREQLIAALTEALPGLSFNTPLDLAVPTTLNFSVSGFTAKELLDLFDAAGIRVSTGSACSSSKAVPSYVLQAMGMSSSRAGSAIRLSFGPAITLEEIATACARIRQCGTALRSNCRLPSAQPSALPQNGLTQLVSDGACSWFLADANSRSCIIIDPLQPLAARLEAYVRCQNYRVLAIIDTHARVDHDSARFALTSALEKQLVSPSADHDGLGWPQETGSVTLANGETAQALTLGNFVVVRTALPGHTAESVAYLIGTPTAEKQLAPDSVRYAFTGDTILDGRLGRTDLASSSAADMHASLLKLAAIISNHSLICPAHDYNNSFVTTLAAEQRTNGLLAQLLHSDQGLSVDEFVAEKRAIDAGGADGSVSTRVSGDTVHISPEALHAFLRDKPNTLLVDVREACEHIFSDLPAVDLPILNIPLSRFAEDIGPLLQNGERRPLLFFCRSGNRGMAAALSVRRLGYTEAWNLSGGVALKVAA